jgi:phosphoribosylanthranilate isomerase
MTATKVKVCGITRPEDATACHVLGADYLGVIFAESPRRVSAGQAAEVRAVVPQARLVGVFATAALDEIVETARVASLDVIQLHGNESPAFCHTLHMRLGLPIIKALPLGRLPEPGSPEDCGAASFYLLDLEKGTAVHEEALRRLWAEAASAGRQGRAVFLAGALDPSNVRQAVDSTAPYGVDVCRGVEKAPGRKNLAAVREFIGEVRSARH